MNMAKKQNDVQTYVEGLFGLGNVYVRMDDIERAMYYLQRCYEKSKEIDDKVMQGKCVTFMASCSGFVFNLPKARHYYGLQKKLPHENEDMKQFYLFITVLSSAIWKETRNRPGNSFILRLTVR